MTSGHHHGIGAHRGASADARSSRVTGSTLLRTFGVPVAAVLGGAAVAALVAAATHWAGAESAAVYGALGAITAGIIGTLGLRGAREAHADPRDELVAAASPLHPLQKRLMAEAPGTYVHSLAVANLSETAAEAVGADALVARVGAYYHDIGKLADPYCFFENSEEGDCPHQGTDPIAAARVIMAHVPDGAALARQSGLPEQVCEIVSQHHGTSLVRYFYHQAALQDAGVYETDFRYPGSRPQSREAAIVMIADSSEASVRALAQPDPSEVRERVGAVLRERKADGQLDECGLTDAELGTIADVIARGLVSFRHVRLAYPAPE